MRISNSLQTGASSTLSWVKEAPSSFLRTATALTGKKVNKMTYDLIVVDLNIPDLNLCRCQHLMRKNWASIQESAVRQTSGSYWVWKFNRKSFLQSWCHLLAFWSLVFNLWGWRLWRWIRRRIWRGIWRRIWGILWRLWLWKWRGAAWAHHGWRVLFQPRWHLHHPQ